MKRKTVTEESSTAKGLIKKSYFKKAAVKLMVIYGLLGILFTLPFYAIEKFLGSDEIFKASLTYEYGQPTPEGFDTYGTVSAIVGFLLLLISLISIYVIYRLAYASLRRKPALPAIVHAKGTALLVLLALLSNAMFSTLLTWAVPVPSEKYIPDNEMWSLYLFSLGALAVVSLLCYYISYRAALNRSEKEKESLFA
jgi:hypothetical protein